MREGVCPFLSFPLHGVERASGPLLKCGGPGPPGRAHHAPGDQLYAFAVPPPGNGSGTCCVSGRRSLAR